MVTETTDARAVLALEEQAAAWLAAEDLALTQPTNPMLADSATRHALAYEQSVAAASREELRLAWEGAQRAQRETLIGTAEWAAARRVAELLRTEYAAAEAVARVDDPPAK